MYAGQPGHSLRAAGEEAGGLRCCDTAGNRDPHAKPSVGAGRDLPPGSQASSDCASESSRLKDRPPDRRTKPTPSVPRASIVLTPREVPEHGSKIAEPAHLGGYQPRDETGCDCPATSTARLPPAVYSGHTPPLRRFKHLADLTQAPATTPAAVAVPGLAAVVHQSVTSLEGVTPRLHVVCPPSRVGIVSAGVAGDFSLRNKKLGLPLDVECSRFGTVSD